MINQNKIVSWCDKIIYWLFGAVIFLTPVYFAYFQENYNVFELNKLLILRTGVWLILSLWLIKAAAGGKITVYNKKLQFGALAVLAVYVVFGAILSVTPSFSWWGNYERQQGVHSLLAYWLFFALWLLHAPSWPQLKKIIIAALAASGLVSWYGVIQHFNWDPQPWMVNEGRAFSALGQPNFLGHYLIMIIPLTVAGYWLFKSKQKYLWLPLLLTAQLSCLLFTASRGAWLGLLGSLLMMFFAWSWFKRSKKIILIGLVVLLLSGGLIWSVARQAGPNCSVCNYAWRLTSSFSTSYDTNKIRLLYWSAAAQELSTAPWWRVLIGFGKDGQANIFLKHYQNEWALYEQLNSFPDRAHNLIVDTVLEFGLLGWLLILGFNLHIFFAGVKYLKNQLNHRDGRYYLTAALLAGTGGYAMAALFGFPLTTHYLYHYWFLALLAGLVRDSRPRFEVNIKFSAFFKYSMAAALIIFIGVIWYFFTVKAFIADVYYMKAKKAEARNNCGDTLYYINKTLDADSSSLKMKEAYAFLNTNCLPLLNQKNDRLTVKNNIISVLDNYPVKEAGYYFWLEKAHAYSVFGRHLDPQFYPTAAEAYMALLKLNPYITVNYQDYAKMKLWSGDYETAEKIVWKGLQAMSPIDAQSQSVAHQNAINWQRYYFYDLLSKIYVKKNDLAKATDYLTKGLIAQPIATPGYQAMADLFWKLGERQMAFDWLAKGKQIDPANETWDYNTALYYLAQKNYQAAVTAAEQALTLQPGDQQTQDLLADIKQAMATSTQP